MGDGGGAGSDQELRQSLSARSDVQGHHPPPRSYHQSTNQGEGGVLGVSAGTKGWEGGGSFTDSFVVNSFVVVIVNSFPCEVPTLLLFDGRAFRLSSFEERFPGFMLAGVEVGRAENVIDSLTAATV